jgi:ribosomal protein L11 methyltransferase
VEVEVRTRLSGQPAVGLAGRQADRELIDILSGIFAQLGFEGFWEDDNILRCYVRKSRWTPEMLDEVKTIVRRMARQSNTPDASIVAREIDDRNWNAEWEKSLQPLQVSNRIVIAPSWSTYNVHPGQLLITVDPKMSFGTGYHESTRLCLRLMEKHLKTGAAVLDVGTGTGILAIAAVMLGGRSAVGIDIDDWSYRNALENVRLNHVEDEVHIIHGEVSSLSMERYDMIVANIQLSVIAVLFPEILKRLKPAGMMLLSGLLFEDRENTLHLLSEGGVTILEELKENEWMAIIASVQE